MHHHKKAQRRTAIIVAAIAIIGTLIAIPILTDDDLRYDLAMRGGLIPGQGVEKLADGDSGAQLITVPLSYGQDTGTSPWLFRAQFISWPSENGLEFEHLDTGQRGLVPIERIEFIAANPDGTLVLLRGNDVESGEPIALMIAPASMEIIQLPAADSVPEVEGDWETSIWEKTGDWCNRPSPNQRFLACFTRSGFSTYTAGDWQLDLQYWGDYEELYPIFRGQGFLPIVGFANEDTVVYMQNERGIWRAVVPENVLEDAPEGIPYTSP